MFRCGEEMNFSGQEMTRTAKGMNPTGEEMNFCGQDLKQAGQGMNFGDPVSIRCAKEMNWPAQGLLPGGREVVPTAQVFSVQPPGISVQCAARAFAED